MTRTRLSTTGLGILGLLALRPFSAYELAQQIHRGLRYMQPASERNLYAEPKRLAAAGLVRMRRQQVGRRSRTIYEITPAGRDALRRQLATPPAPPQLEFEALQRLIFADQASKEDLLAALDTTSQQVQQLLEDGLQQVRGYQADGGPFPQRLHLIVLFARFSTDFLLLLRDWLALARREAASWPATRDLGLTDGTRQMLQDLLQLADQLTPDPEPGLHRASRHPGPAQQALEGGRQGPTG